MFKDGESLCANRDGTGRYDAQIELFPNGDFAMRSNIVETVCRRVNPDDWDGDGLANEIDGCPTECDGDCFGTSAAWYSEGCGSLLWGETNMATSLKTGAMDADTAAQATTAGERIRTTSSPGCL